MTEPDLPPEVLAALRAPKTESEPDHSDEDPNEGQASPPPIDDDDDEYYDRQWDKGWLSDVSSHPKKSK